MNRLLTEKEVLELLGVSRSTLRRLIAFAKLPCVDLSSSTSPTAPGPRTRRYPERELHAWIADRVRVEVPDDKVNEPRRSIPQRQRRVLT